MSLNHSTQLTLRIRVFALAVADLVQVLRAGPALFVSVVRRAYSMGVPRLGRLTFNCSSKVRSIGGFLIPTTITPTSPW